LESLINSLFSRYSSVNQIILPIQETHLPQRKTGPQGRGHRRNPVDRPEGDDTAIGRGLTGV
jgi:hypothetical protein